MQGWCVQRPWSWRDSMASEVECSVMGYQRLGAGAPRACDMARPAARQRTEKALDGFLKC